MLFSEFKTKYITKIAAMSALVYFATYFFKVPSLTGYTHLGDCMVFISVLILGTKKGALASGIGSALADLLGGYMQWIIPTFFIKFIMATLLGVTITKLLPKLKFNWIIGSSLGGIFQIIAYTLVKIPLFGLPHAISTLPGIFAQTLTNIIIASVLVTVLSSSKLFLNSLAKES